MNEPAPSNPPSHAALRWRLWLLERLAPSDWQVTLAWAALIGIGGGLSSILFREAVHGLHLLLTGSPAGMVESFSHLEPWRRCLIPALGGFLAGAILLIGRRLTPGKPTTDYMEAIALGDGKVPFRTSLIKSTAALFAIAAGGSIGREGPMVQLAAVIASRVGQWRSFSTPRLRLLVACGGAAGIASAYNAPIGGAFFVAEIILGTIAMESLGPLVVAAVAATLTVRILQDAHTLYQVPHFTLHSLWEILPYLGLGVLAGLVAPLFLRLLRRAEKLFDQMSLPLLVRLTLGGLIVGVIAVWVPEVCGNGYSMVVAILNGNVVWSALLLIVVCKGLATGASVGSGAPGGVFTPTLFMGASLGFLVGSGAHALAPAAASDPKAFALVGMGAFLAAASHAPVMAIILLFEMTLSYDIILPLMLASTVAYFTARQYEGESLYGDFMRRREAHDPDRTLPPIVLSDLLRAQPAVVTLAAPFSEIARAFIQAQIDHLYVVDHQGRLAGVISLHDIKPYLGQPDLAACVIAADILRESVPSLTRSTSLAEALATFARSEFERLPVVATDGSLRIEGTVAKNDLLLALAESGAATKGATRKSADTR